MSLIIVQDTREKSPVKFFDKVEKIKLDEGDYTSKFLLDYEKKTGEKTVRIERKKSTSELANNLGKGFDRFERELERLYPYKRKILLCEFSYEDIIRFPEGSGIPKSKLYRKGSKGMIRNVRMTPDLILNKLEYIQNIYEIEVIYTKNSRTVIKEILSDFEEKVKGKVS